MKSGAKRRRTKMEILQEKMEQEAKDRDTQAKLAEFDNLQQRLSQVEQVQVAK